MSPARSCPLAVCRNSLLPPGIPAGRAPQFGLGRRELKLLTLGQTTHAEHRPKLVILLIGMGNEPLQRLRQIWNGFGLIRRAKMPDTDHLVDEEPGNPPIELYHQNPTPPAWDGGPAQEKRLQVDDRKQVSTYVCNPFDP